MKTTIFSIMVGLTLLMEGVSFASEAAEQITVSTNAIGFTTATLNAKNVATAVCTIAGTSGEYVRVRMDGTSPTATTGMKIGVDSQIVVTDRDSISKFKAIRNTANTADIILDCEYFAK